MLKNILFGLVSLYFVCEVISLPKPSTCPALKLKYGRVRYRQRARFVRFSCNNGYILAGEKYSTCHQGVWDTPLPKCVRASCKKVDPPPNCFIFQSHRGAVLNFFCKPGFDLRGPNITYCDGFKWDNKLPTCIESNKQPALTCDFESEDLCGWNQDLHHDFDWTRMNLKTPSGHLETGPSFDHTKGPNENGYYMYIESSSRRVNDTARLISPIFNSIPDSDVCLEFYYHMHGIWTGQLRVYLKKESDPWDLNESKAMFSREGNHGDRWLRSFVYIGPISEDFQIIFEGVRGQSYLSDIAIDDISIIPNCAYIEATTTSDLPFTDDFGSDFTCVNRCETDFEGSYNLFNCSCKEECVQNRNCCPDYYAACVLNATDDFTMMDDESTSTESYNTETTEIVTTTNSINTQLKTSKAPKLTFLTTRFEVIVKRTTKPATTTASTSTKLSTTTEKPVKAQTTSVKILKMNKTVFDTLHSTSMPQLFFRNADTSEKNTENSGISSKLIIVVVASIGMVLFSSAIVAVINMKYQCFRCRNVTKFNNSHGDSQSDVRFLTSDEALDFSLSYPDD